MTRNRPNCSRSFLRVGPEALSMPIKRTANNRAMGKASREAVFFVDMERPNETARLMIRYVFGSLNHRIARSSVRQESIINSASLLTDAAQMTIAGEKTENESARKKAVLSLRMISRSISAVRNEAIVT